MRKELIADVMQRMLPYLDNAQMKQLEQAMENVLQNYEITGIDTGFAEEDNQSLLDAFLSSKRIEGCSEKTLKYYRTTLEIMLASLEKMCVVFLRKICGLTRQKTRTGTSAAR